MVSHLVFYQLGLIALVWVFLMLSWLWPSEPAAARPMTPKLLMPRGKRSQKPQPFQRRFPRSEILQQSEMRRRSFCPEHRMTCDGKVDRFILPSG